MSKEPKGRGRNNPTVRQAAELLVAWGVIESPATASARKRMEDHSQVGLQPPGNPTATELAAFEAELLKSYRPGPGATERAAFALLGRGVPSDLIDQERLPTDQADPDPETDEGSRAVEAEAAALIARTNDGPGAQLLARVMAILRSNVKTAPVFDPYLDRPLPEDPEITLRSAAAQLIGMSYGGPPAQPETTMSISGQSSIGDSQEHSELMGLLADFQESTTNLVDEASQVPAQVKARGAVLVRSMLDRFLPAPHDPDELDEIAGRLYPLGVAYLQMGIPELVAAMEGGQFVDGPEIGHELAAFRQALPEEIGPIDTTGEIGPGVLPASPPPFRGVS
jgi:hypothetical protein